jgi:formylglycine-generating enzyme required for sulfatase activity
VIAPPDTSAFVLVPAGRFLMGTTTGGYPDDGEGPVHAVQLSAFRVDRVAVSNDRWAAFVDATGHQTIAERDGWSFVFAGLLPDDFPPTQGVAAAPWWRKVAGADWCHPDGPQSDLDGRGGHPVVHVSWFDAVAFCDWSDTRLPTEAEWERAARGGLEQMHFPWGDEREPGGDHRMNVFQGRFPGDDTGADGWVGTCPVDAFEPNGLGLYNPTGNVWEWCRDWFDTGFYGHSPAVDPKGPGRGTHRVMRGGSYLCHESYCNRYRVDSRSANTPDSTTGNLGFRVAADA